MSRNPQAPPTSASSPDQVEMADYYSSPPAGRPPPLPTYPPQQPSPNMASQQQPVMHQGYDMAPARLPVRGQSLHRQAVQRTNTTTTFSSESSGSYPPMPHHGHPDGGYRVRLADPQAGLSQAQLLNEKSGMGETDKMVGTGTTGKRYEYKTPPSLSRNPSTDLLGGGAGRRDISAGSSAPTGNTGFYKMKEGTDGTENPSFMFAEGDFVPHNKVSKAWLHLLRSSMLFRWLVFIIPMLGILWIPGIIDLTSSSNPRVWSVGLLWWSIWLSVVWLGWWGASLLGMLGPPILKYTIGVVAPESRHYIEYLRRTRRHISIFIWSIAIWITFHVLVKTHVVDATTNNRNVLRYIERGLLGIMIDCGILLAEKLIIQIIAFNFHRKSYEDRIALQKFQIRSLVTLYLNSRDIGRSDTLDKGYLSRKVPDPTRVVKSALKHVKRVAQTTTTALGTVASEIAGERVLQPTSAPSMVTSALSSSKKTQMLARRIFFSFTKEGAGVMYMSDIERFFKSRDEAKEVFAIFDRDDNGDVTLEEIELACLDIHQERLALASSMRDLDGAVGNLDSILMTMYWLVAILVIVGCLDIGFTTLLASAGTLILGLSWLIGATAQEILASIIFLLCKHPYDVSDRVDIDGESYIVKEMYLLSTVFRRVDGKVLQAPHSVLNSKIIFNIRRSGAISETFEWDVAFDTGFEKIEALRMRMLSFLEEEKRDFLPAIDISVKDFAGQEKITLKADIKYKSNWQNGVLKAQRRNKWLCALKLAMGSLSMYGPGGAGNPSPDTDITHVRMVDADFGKKNSDDFAPPTSPFLDNGEVHNLKFSDNRAQFHSAAQDVLHDRARDDQPRSPTGAPRR